MSGLLDSVKSAFSTSGDQGGEESDDGEQFFFDKVTHETNVQLQSARVACFQNLTRQLHAIRIIMLNPPPAPLAKRSATMSVWVPVPSTCTCVV